MSTKTINLATQKAKINIASEVAFIFSAPKLKKERDILVLNERFGLDGNKSKTLEEIGKSLGVTRERVRQIEKNTLKKLSDFVKNDLRGQEITDYLTAKLLANGGVMEKKAFENAITIEGAPAKTRHGLAFIIACVDSIEEQNETNELNGGYYLSSVDNKVITKVVREAVTELEKEKSPIEESTFLEQLSQLFPEITLTTIAGAISLSKKIIKTETGQVGLSHWRDINPRSIKDKTYYLLKRHNKPLHYAEIAEKIQTVGNKEKHVTKQAVHNELIRDERFVLIGRGIYALSEWGYTGGVVEDVIVEILENAGTPMHKDEIVAEVLKKRIVKDTTILLNLQKDRFKRVARATYTLANRGETSATSRH